MKKHKINGVRKTNMKRAESNLDKDDEGNPNIRFTRNVFSHNNYN